MIFITNEFFHDETEYPLERHFTQSQELFIFHRRSPALIPARFPPRMFSCWFVLFAVFWAQDFHGVCQGIAEIFNIFIASSWNIRNNCYFSKKYDSNLRWIFSIIYESLLWFWMFWELNITGKKQLQFMKLKSMANWARFLNTFH